jgi:hypothetical protein
MTGAALPETRIAPPVQTDWQGCRMLALERLPIPFPLLVLIAGLFAVAEQVAEYFTSVPALRNPPRVALAEGAVIVIMIVYILAYLGLLKRRSIHGLARLHAAVKITDAEFDRHARAMLNANPRVETALLLASIVVVLLMFGVGNSDGINRPDQGLPAVLPLALIMALAYLLVGWLLLTLVYTSVRYARALHTLARCPLEVNVFDPMNLLPFGELSLLHSVSVAGLFLIPLILLGPPARAGFIVIGLSAISLVSLFIPLWGVHRQMTVAKERALDQIYIRLMDTHQTLMERPPLDSETLGDLTNRTSLLVTLRELVLKSPNWPFRDVASLLRATLAVASPFLIYLLQRMLDLYVVPLFAR